MSDIKTEEERVELIQKRFIEELPINRLKRIAVIEKHKKILDASIIGKQKGIRFRKYFYDYVTTLAYKVFLTEEEEYQAIGKAGRRLYTDHDKHLKTYYKKDPMNEVISDIMREFGCFNY